MICDNPKLNESVKRCFTMCKESKIKPGNITEFTVNTRAKRRWGQCCEDLDGNYRISISNRLLADDVKQSALDDTVMHEILHTCEGCLNHSNTWKKYANIINTRYGLNIKVSTSAQEKGLPDIPSVLKVKHRFVCEGCGNVVELYRESAFTRNYEDYMCSKCYGKFRKEF